MGNATREYPRPQRFQVHRDERVQRSHHVRDRSSSIVCTAGAAGRRVRHHQHLHHVLLYDNALSGVRSQGETGEAPI